MTRAKPARRPDTPIDAPPEELEFDISGIWLDSAYYHPLSVGARRAMALHMHARRGMAMIPPTLWHGLQARVRHAYARLIGASAADIAFVPSATAAENMVVRALRLGPGSRVISDALHFHGSLCIYRGLREQGVDVVILPMSRGRIPLTSLEEALKTRTDLVAVSSVSYANGFTHDLAELCRIAHHAGARVYADITQSVGAVPIDVAALAIDFCGTSSYKWLMGDMGVGLLYVRPDRLPGLVRPHFGSRQAINNTHDVGATGRKFEVGTPSLTGIAALDYSLGQLLRLSPEAIARHRRPLCARIRQELAELGLPPLTPVDCDGPIQAFRADRTNDLVKALNESRIFATVGNNRLRISMSVFNNHAELDVLMEALRKWRG